MGRHTRATMDSPKAGHRTEAMAGPGHKKRTMASREATWSGTGWDRRGIPAVAMRARARRGGDGEIDPGCGREPSRARGGVHAATAQLDVDGAVDQGAEEGQW